MELGYIFQFVSLHFQTKVISDFSSSLQKIQCAVSQGSVFSNTASSVCNINDITTTNVNNTRI